MTDVFPLKTWRDWELRKKADRFRFALLMTGGTLIMVPNEHGALEPAKNPQDFIRYAKHLEDKAEIEIFPIMNKDSSNMVSADWITIAQAIAERQAFFDGFIVTHGTDTIAYSATAVRFALGNHLYAPVVFTGSQLPIHAPRTDAITNLEDSVATLAQARQKGINEVMVVAGRQIHRGTRSVKVSESRFEFIGSPGFAPLGISTAAGIELTHPEIQSLQAGLPEKSIEEESISLSQNLFDDNIISIRIQPNTSVKVLETTLLDTEPIPYSGVILTSLGAGNPPDRILPFIELLVTKNIPILITPPETGMDTAAIYEAARQAVALGAIQTGDMTNVSTSVKLSWLLSNPKIKGHLKLLQEEILRDYFGEISSRDRWEAH